MTLKERLEKQLDILEKAQVQALNIMNLEAVARLSAQILAVSMVLEQI